MKKNLFTLTLLVFLSVSFSFSQSQLNHPKKMYQTPEGKLYINKDLPIYIKVAASPDTDAQSYLLQSEDSKAYTNPMYLDTEGYNSIHSPSKVDTVTKKIVYPLEDIIFEVYADSRHPATKIDYSGKNSYIKEGIHYFSGELEIVLTATDAMSGVEEMYYSINGAAYQKTDGNIKLDNEKEYTLKYYSVDHVGNVEPVNEVIIYLDFTDPKTDLSVTTDQYEDILSPRSEIVLEANDEISKVKHIKYSIDGKPERTYYKSLKLNYLSEGEHEITFYAVDNVDNQEDTKTYQFYLDKTPPIIVDELLGNSFIANGMEFSSGRAKIKLTAMDNKSGVKEIRYSVNDGEFVEYTTPFSLSQSGKVKIQSFVIDKVNNQSISTIMTNKQNHSYFDLSGPKLGYSIQGPHFVSKDTVFITSESKIALSGQDAEAGFKKINYHIDDSSGQDYEEPIKVETEGYHTISYTGFDNVENSSHKKLFVFVDDTGPDIYTRFSINTEKHTTHEGKKLDVFPSHTVLFLSATDQNVGLDKIYYSINGAARKQYMSLISGFSNNTYYKVEVSAIDKLGNESVNTIEFYIE